MARPKRNVDNTKDVLTLENIQIREIRVEVPIEVEKIVIKETIKEVEKPRLEGFELYAKLRDLNFYQGGYGQTMENPNGIDKVYIPEVADVYQLFAVDPDKWGLVRDALCRVWIEIKESEHGNN